MEIRLRLTVVRDKPYVRAPQYISARAKSADGAGQFYTTTGVGPDLLEATKDAVRCMISYLEHEYALTREDAYMLCSVAGDLHLHEVVRVFLFLSYRCASFHYGCHNWGKKQILLWHQVDMPNYLVSWVL
jgi:acetamidase/formamidase